MYVDTDVFYAIIKEEDRLKDWALAILKRNEMKYTSAVTLLELEIIIKRELSDEMSMNLPEIIRSMPIKLVTKPFDEKILENSLQLRKRYTLGIFDSIHAATALLHDKRIASSDETFDNVEGLKRIFV